MSIAIGIYDLFSYIIPGALYLFIFNDFMRLIGWQYIDIMAIIQRQKNLGLLEFVLFIFVAYLAGNIFEAFRSVILDRWLYYDVADKALEKIKRRLSHSNLDMGFNSDDWSICQEVLQVRNPETVQEKERFKANALMMRNFSFAAFVYGFVQLAQFLKQTTSLEYLAFSLLSLIVTNLTYRRARRFDDWSYRAVYSQALAYGSNLKEFLENSTPQWKQTKTGRKAPQRKKQTRSK